MNLWAGDVILNDGPTNERRFARMGMIPRKGQLFNGAPWLIAIGVILLAVYATSVIHRVVFAHLALREFDRTRVIARAEDGKARLDRRADQPIAFGKHLRTKKGSLLAVLRCQRLSLNVPVFEGTDNWTLNRGAGWIPGTTRPGEAGNIGVAAHRDSFFRALKDIRKGDLLELISAARTDEYSVDQVEIVGPENVSVLQARPVPSLTLVTCYPFYFVGAAPSRFIVHAVINTGRRLNVLESGSTVRVHPG